MTTVDLSRIPEVLRERVQREMSDAQHKAGLRTSAPWCGEVEADAALARYLKIADEADAAAADAWVVVRDGVAPSAMIAPRRERARVEVWARRMAERDAMIAQPEPPPGYWSTGIAVERKADVEPADEDAVQAVRAAQRAHLDATRRSAGVHITLHGFPDGLREAHVHTPTGLRLTLDGLLRYLADKPRETVATINALLRTLPHSSYLTVGLGTSTPEAHALLVSLGGRDRVVDYYGSALHHCCIEIDGIEWRASYTPAPSRPTIAGAAGLDMAARAGGDR